MAAGPTRWQLACACAVIVALAAALALSGTPRAGAVDAGCDVFAAPADRGGDNSNPGTSVDAPVRTIRRLMAIVPRGRGEADRGVACVRGGTYDFSKSLGVSLEKPWTMVRPYDGEAATLVGRFRIAVGARHSVVEGLTLNGRRKIGRDLPSLLIYGDNAVVRNNKITNDSTAICVHVDDYYGDRARGVTIADNEIYGCGAIQHLNHDHGIYIAAADGTRVLGNYIHDNQDRGIQLWPDADGSLIQGNVVDHNGQGVSIGGKRRARRDLSSDGNLVRGNLITRSHASYADPDGAGPIQSNTHGWNLEFFRNRAGKGNVIEENCFFADHPDDYYTSNGGINLADTDGVPISVAIRHNAILREDPLAGGGTGPALGRSGCQDDSLISSALPRDCTPLTMNQWAGTPGPDQFSGTDLRDHAAGADGEDSVSGAGASDCLFGGAGNDTVAGDGDLDRLFGDDGDDTLISREAAEADWRFDDVSCGGGGADVVFADITDVLAADCERPLYRDP